jgi:hypothetical protein
MRHIHQHQQEQESLQAHGATTPNPATIIVLRQTLEKAGVEFIDEDRPGVRMKRKRTRP